MSSLKSRVLVSVVGVPLLLWVVLGAPTIVMVIALCALAAIGGYELQQCVSGTERKELASTSAIVALLTVYWCWRGTENLAVLVFAAVLFLLILRKSRQDNRTALATVSVKVKDIANV